MTKISNFQPLPPMIFFLWGILQGIPYNKLTSIINKNHHRSRTKLLAYWQELSNPTVHKIRIVRLYVIEFVRSQRNRAVDDGTRVIGSAAVDR